MQTLPIGEAGEKIYRDVFEQEETYLNDNIRNIHDEIDEEEIKEKKLRIENVKDDYFNIAGDVLTALADNQDKTKYVLSIVKNLSNKLYNIDDYANVTFKYIENLEKLIGYLKKFVDNNLS